MSVYIFTGPTISAQEGKDILDATYLPPVAEGDVYRVTRKSPQVIGIIDGYFQKVPSVQHKEILWAMKQGIHVFGAASMGALRASELLAFGMEGVGTIFEDYRDGILEDDDEVAIAHSDSDTNYHKFSEAMVNIRATLRSAELDGAVAAELRHKLQRMAKQMFYPNRSYDELLRYAALQGVSDIALGSLEQWLATGKRNLKREDAVCMLRLIGTRVAEGLQPKQVHYSFEHTTAWQAAVKGAYAR